jgi:hypothetical protein
VIALVGRAAKLWFYANWMYAGLIAGLFLFAVLPLFGGAWSTALVAVYLQLPAYMIHQVEEHSGDRFRRFVNKEIARVPNALTTPAVVFINVPLVWGVDLVAIYLARFVSVGWGLIAIYLMLVNGVVHIIGGVVKREYNPGLVTGIVIFIPLSIWGLVAVAAAPGVTAAQHIVSLVLAILVHVGIVVYVVRRAKMLRGAAAPA